MGLTQSFGAAFLMSRQSILFWGRLFSFDYIGELKWPINAPLDFYVTAKIEVFLM